jgi:TPR repeat protein
MDLLTIVLRLICAGCILMACMRSALRHALAAVILVLSLAAPVAAGPLEDAIAAHNTGDHATVLRLLRPLASQGDSFAQGWLGGMYYEGRGVPQNYAEALKWFRLAADQGNSAAQALLGVMYNRAQGVPQDYAEAVKWFRLAADQDDAGAQYDLGFMYFRGWGVPQDYIRAHMWSNLSAAQGNQIASAQRDSVARFMTPAQIAEAQRLAREWRPR